MDFRAEQIIVNCGRTCYRQIVKNLSRFGDSISHQAISGLFIGEITDVARWRHRLTCREFPYRRTVWSGQTIRLLEKSHFFHAQNVHWTAIAMIGPLGDT